MARLEWASFFIGWLLKWLMLRYGGPKRTLALRPFFLGLIIGPLLTAGVWTIIDCFTGMQMNQVLHFKL